MKLRFAASTPLLACALAMLAACGESGNTNAAAPNSIAAAPAPAGQDWTQVVSKTADGGFVMGNPNAPLKLVEYGSRTCPTCGNFGRTGTRPLEDNYIKTGKVSYEFRDFLVHAPDLGVAILGQCAGETPFFQILEQMFVEQDQFLQKLESVPADFQQRLQGMSPAQQATAWVEHLGYVDWVKQRGLTETQARQCLSDSKRIEDLAKVSEVAMRDKEVTGTPTFILNGEKLDAASWPQVEQALKAAGA
ncbi:MULTISPECIES: thioredoxin domain-containing protein [unclassified Sphingomonas]|uniref:thioredoxin domain-containing protein n=1 Tax=unclassified Sphingomonas TaxID=196159 RepID=UPI001D1172BF|nr:MULTISPECIES: thioredoxin domain-containing protein [unclassified Sphingomonas]MCC2981520.1 DsbA family protein [Sphingomonas sp. IC4-52]MCD2317453.1 DsbA family protein [Sphingomonas sp. IC-11]